LVEADETNPYNLLGEIEILQEVNKRFNTKAGDKQRVLKNTVASQPCCFNLIAPLKFDRNSDLADALFSNLLKKEVNVLDIEIEFTPTEEESIGDQSKIGGTDADLAVSYTDKSGKKGIILIEFKYIEQEFSRCTSYKDKNGREKDGKTKINIRPTCDSYSFYEKHVLNANEKNPECGYVKYQNWPLTSKSELFDIGKIKNSNSCPFKFSLNQLWRNFLLCEKVSKVRELDEFQFWVLSPKRNTFLWTEHGSNVKTQFEDILTEFGKSKFKTFDIESDVVDFLEKNTDDSWNLGWIKKYREKYISNKYAT
jgi:hypothetical protein